MDVGKLESVSLRDIWKNEARKFLPWLQDNMDVLGERLGFDLSFVEREKSAGSFSVDLVAQAGDETAVIECQYGKTDHDHLGKVLTYLSSLDAKIAIWICEDPRPEHVNAVTWLNAFAPADVSFYLVKVEGVKIGDSPPAPLFSVICSPSEEARNIGEQKRELAEGQRKRVEFWTRLLEKSKGKTKVFENISPSKENWISTGAGTSGFAYAHVITRKRGRVELYIDKGDREQNKRGFDELHSKKDEIEEKFGDSLDWQRLNEKRASRICKEIDFTGLEHEGEWDKLQEKMIDAMIRLEGAMKGPISRLRF